MNKIYNTKTRVYGVGHEMFSCTMHIIAILQEPRTFQLNSSNEQLLVSHWWSQNTSSQKTIPCFFVNPSCDAIVKRKGINNIKKLCQHRNHQIQMFTKPSSQSCFHEHQGWESSFILHRSHNLNRIELYHFHEHKESNT